MTIKADEKSAEIVERLVLKWDKQVKEDEAVFKQAQDKLFVYELAMIDSLSQV